MLLACSGLQKQPRVQTNGAEPAATGARVPRSQPWPRELLASGICRAVLCSDEGASPHLSTWRAYKVPWPNSLTPEPGACMLGKELVYLPDLFHDAKYWTICLLSRLFLLPHPSLTSSRRGSPPRLLPVWVTDGFRMATSAIWHYTHCILCIVIIILIHYTFNAFNNLVI